MQLCSPNGIMNVGSQVDKQRHGQNKICQGQLKRQPMFARGSTLEHCTRKLGRLSESILAPYLDSP